MTLTDRTRSIKENISPFVIFRPVKALGELMFQLKSLSPTKLTEKLHKLLFYHHCNNVVTIIIIIVSITFITTTPLYHNHHQSIVSECCKLTLAFLKKGNFNNSLASGLKILCQTKANQVITVTGIHKVHLPLQRTRIHIVNAL